MAFQEILLVGLRNFNFLLRKQSDLNILFLAFIIYLYICLSNAQVLNRPITVGTGLLYFLVYYFITNLQEFELETLWSSITSHYKLRWLCNLSLDLFVVDNIDFVQTLMTTLNKLIWHLDVEQTLISKLMCDKTKIWYNMKIKNRNNKNSLELAARVVWGGWCTRLVSGPYGVGLLKNISQGWPSFSCYILYDIGDG